jgi:copper/silver efflux system protein
VPMIGGMVSSTVLTLVVIPALYAALHQLRLKS